ncbi:acyl-CoA carboxylase subunit beta [Hydrogenophaga sp. BPS33]|uniref:acyl-CoA carboxylase subunit beta n=1 Tax=Hydrogenophaga sp. BPS33 TaxID=2651974 RepID=UPI00132046CC|nr:carboxyl transferase domain-containing protein [Hydrogenophaga sp. BPS33]QHE86054.1 propionyl-CoA carboxylase [Hydrogenophaga sp. BPS33]
MTHPSSEWQPELDEMAQRRAGAAAHGGEEAVARLRAAGKRTAREHLLAIADPGSFRELGMLAGKGRYGAQGQLESFTPSNHVMGLAHLNGRRTVVIADDSSIRGGSSEAAVSEKWIYADRYANEYKLPLVRFVDTAGGSVKLLQQMGHTKIPGYALLPSQALLGEVPVVGVAVGACAGLGALRVATAHFTVMVRGQSQVFAAGPPVVKQALGIDIDKEALGGADVHRESGLVNNIANSQDDAFEMVRKFLSYMPANVWEQPSRGATADDPHREEPWLNDAIPRNRRKTFAPLPILKAIFDTDSVFEISPQYGRSTVTALARLHGYPVGVITNNPAIMGGALTAAAARKLERFVDMCDTFHLPIVNLPDQPGTMTGPNAEREGTMIATLKASAAIEQSTVPWISVVLRRTFGLAGSMLGPWVGPSGTALPHRFGWPSARWGSIPIEGGVAAAFKREIEASDDPQKTRDELEASFAPLGSPYRTAERFGVVDIIEPAQTRSLLCDWVGDAYRKTQRNLGPKLRPMR